METKTMMHWTRALAAGAAAGMLTLALGAAPGAAPSPADNAPLTPIASAPAGGQGVALTVMTYNVHGLPWPIVENRSAALEAIGARLAAMRRAGTAPDVIVLQEAFTGTARAIGREAGYPYIAHGPAARTPGLPDAGPMPTSFYPLRGEGIGSFVSSGLEILSAYPILSVSRAAFPRADCAGYDCLANKGVLLARIAVPGVAAPVEILTAHINSRAATGTPRPHANAAYYGEMDALGRFLRAQDDPRSPLVIAGDFNIDHDAGRLAYFRKNAAAWGAARGAAPSPAGIVAICGTPDQRCTAAADPVSLNLARRTNDWQWASGGSAAGARAVACAMRFTPDPRGRTLSDHQGLVVRYRLAAAPAPVAKT